MAKNDGYREYFRKIEEECESNEFESVDDSDDDPSFDVEEETRLALSKLSIKKSGARRCKSVDADLESEPDREAVGDAILELDEKSFDKVEQLIKDGHLEELKVEQCKVYLRNHGLRLSGNKGIIISRIREHQEIINGCGEKKYPPESFVLNCKGDACLGDVVIFEQKVYEMYSIASRSATGPPCGTRIVAGRIVKESYGVAKQQHTFTIEVLWSKGEKPLPPLHQLLIKGRNLYRIKTMRQRWDDERERIKVLQEKHGRGSDARHSRQLRIEEKEKRKNGMLIKRKKSTGVNIPVNKENQHPLKPDAHQINVLDKKKDKHELVVRSKPANPANTQQKSDIVTLQPPTQSILGKPKTAENDSLSAQAGASINKVFSSYHRSSFEKNNRIHAGTSQAPPPTHNFQHPKQAVHKHHNHHHHDFRAEYRNVPYGRPHVPNHYMANPEFRSDFLYSQQQLLWVNKSINYAPWQQLYPGRQKQPCHYFSKNQR